MEQSAENGMDNVGKRKQNLGMGLFEPLFYIFTRVEASFFTKTIPCSFFVWITIMDKNIALRGKKNAKSAKSANRTTLSSILFVFIYGGVDSSVYLWYDMVWYFYRNKATPSQLVV